jgi:hypothetical protein
LSKSSFKDYLLTYKWLATPLRMAVASSEPREDEYIFTSGSGLPLIASRPQKMSNRPISTSSTKVNSCRLLWFDRPVGLRMPPPRHLNRVSPWGGSMLPDETRTLGFELVLPETRAAEKSQLGTRDAY